MGRDPVKRQLPVVAVVASAGGVEALSAFVSGLPPDFGASVLVVLHIPSQGPSVLPDILSRAGPLPARHPRDGDVLEPGVIFVAPPDHHLTVSGGSVRVLPGPPEHGHRPSADILLRSVAQTYGPRCAGVVLSGTMDDGAAGLRVVRALGGLAIVQDPAEAAFSGMPASAIVAAEGAVVSAAQSMGERLAYWLEELDDPAPEKATLT